MDAYIKLLPTIFAKDKRFETHQKKSVAHGMPLDAYSCLGHYAFLALCSQSKDSFINLALAIDALRYIGMEAYFESLTKDLNEKVGVSKEVSTQGINKIRSSQNDTDIVSLSNNKAKISLLTGDSFVIVANPENKSLQLESDSTNNDICIEIDGNSYCLSGKEIAKEAYLEARNRYFRWFRNRIIREEIIPLEYKGYLNARAEAKDLASEFRANPSAENLGKLLNKMSEMDKEARGNYIFDGIDDNLREIINTAFSDTRWTFEYEPFEDGTAFVVWHDDDNPHTEARCSVFATTPEAKDRVTIPHAKKLEEEDEIREYFENPDKRKKLISEIPAFDDATTEDCDCIPWH